MTTTWYIHIPPTPEQQRVIEARERLEREAEKMDCFVQCREEHYDKLDYDPHTKAIGYFKYGGKRVGCQWHGYKSTAELKRLPKDTRVEDEYGKIKTLAFLLKKIHDCNLPFEHPTKQREFERVARSWGMTKEQWLRD